MSGWRFAFPSLLLLAPAGLAAAWFFARRRRRSDSRLQLPRAGVSLRLGQSRWVTLDRALPWARGLVLLLLALALARPQAGASVEDVSTEGVDIVVALDISASMRAEDFKPDNRLTVARRTVQDFAKGRPSDRLGLVIFGSVATTRCPLTLDHDMLLGQLEQVDFAPREQGGTAIGMGLATAVNRLRESKAKSKVVLLVTDGMNTAGQIGPKTAADAAKALGIKVYTIGVGSKGEVPMPIDQGPLGRRYVMVKTDLDEPLLTEIAGSTGGRYFRATDGAALAAIFETIDGLERTRIESRVRVIYTELFHLALLPAVGLLLLERLLTATRLRRIP